MIRQVLPFIFIFFVNQIIAQNKPASLQIVYTEMVQTGFDSVQLNLKFNKFVGYTKKDISMLIIRDSSYYTYNAYDDFRYKFSKILDSVSVEPNIAYQQNILLMEQAKLEPLKNFNIVYAKKIGTNDFAINETTYDEGKHRKFFLRDTIETIRWTLLPDIKQLDSFSCQKAEGKFRGRVWEAWFTSQIPIDAGPWKLSGLPGLIVEARDTSGKYAFICKSITSPIKQLNIKSTILDKTVSNVTVKEWRNILFNTFQHDTDFFKNLINTVDQSTINNDPKSPETKKLMEHLKMTRAASNFIYYPIESINEN